MKLSTIFLSILILSGCKDNFPSIKPQERCVIAFEQQIEVDGTKFYSGFCRCHLYEWNLSRIGRIGESQNYEIEKCNKLIGFTPDTYEKVYTWWDSIRMWLARRSK